MDKEQQDNNNEDVDDDENLDENDTTITNDRVMDENVIRYSLSTLLSFRSTKTSQVNPIFSNSKLSCILSSYKSGQERGERSERPERPDRPDRESGRYQAAGGGAGQSISPLSFKSTSSSSSSLSQQQYKNRYQGDQGNGGPNYSNSKYYYNKYNKMTFDDRERDTSNQSLNRMMRSEKPGREPPNNKYAKKSAFTPKYCAEIQITSKNILGSGGNVMTASDYRNSTKQALNNMRHSNENQLNNNLSESAGLEGKAGDVKDQESSNVKQGERDSKDSTGKNLNGAAKQDGRMKAKELLESEINANELLYGEGDCKDAEEINIDDIFSKLVPYELVSCFL